MNNETNQNTFNEDNSQLNSDINVYQHNSQIEIKHQVNNKKIPTTIIIVFIVICLAIVKYYPIFSDNYDEINNSRELAKLIEVLPDSNNLLSLPYREPNFYFPYKDKLYYYDYKENSLFVMNLDCSDKKLLSSSWEMNFPSFYLVYKNEAYFYNIEGYHNMTEKKINKKVNLMTGEVTTLDNDYQFLPLSFNNGTIISLGNINSTDFETFRKYNLDTGSVDFENKYKYNAAFEYIYDYSNGNYYGVKYEKNNTTVNYELYKNNTFLANFTINDIYTHPKYGFLNRILYVDDSSLFLSDTSLLYKYDINTNKVERTENIDLSKFSIIKSNGFDTLFIYNENDYYLYELDKNNVSLTKLFKAPEEKQNSISEFSSMIYDTASKIILTIQANNLRYKTKEDKLGNVVIYDKISKDIRIIENVRRAFFDYENNFLYIFIKYNDIYNIEKISLKQKN